MAEHKELMKISKAGFGFGGYQEAMFGFDLVFSAPGSGCATFEGTWSSPPSDHAEWTVSDQEAHWVKAMRLLMQTLQDAKKRHVSELVGVPVELTFDAPFGKLQSWRVLTEVL